MSKINSRFINLNIADPLSINGSNIYYDTTHSINQKIDSISGTVANPDPIADETQLNNPTSVTFNYDVNGRLSSMAEVINNNTRNTTFSYNVSNQLSQIVTTYLTKTKTETITYDTSSNITSVAITYA